MIELPNRVVLLRWSGSLYRIAGPKGEAVLYSFKIGTIDELTKYLRDAGFSAEVDPRPSRVRLPAPEIWVRLFAAPTVPVAEAAQ